MGVFRLIMTNEEIRNEVLKRAKELKAKRAKKKRIIYSCVPASICLVIAIGMFSNHTWRNGGLITDEPLNSVSGETVPSSTKEPSTSTTDDQNIQANKIAVSLFTASVKNPDYDAFGEDEYAHVDVVINGNKKYKQLKLNQYAEYSLKTELTESDFGEFIGTVVEVNDTNNKNIKVCSQDPALKNSSVYYYKPIGNDAVVIVKNEKHCSIFVFEQFADNKGHSIKEIYSIFGVNSENDIDFLTYTIHGMNNSEYKVVDSGTVTKENKIKNFYDLTSSLTPLTASSSVSAAPDWLNAAYDEYQKNPEKYTREDITVDVHLKNGLVISEIYYQPYIANGYVENMEALSPEQNKLLRDVFRAD